MLIYDDEHIQAIFSPGDSDFRLVTFSDMYSQSDGHSFWAKTFVEKIGISTIGIISKAPNWFPLTSMLRASATIERRLGFSNFDVSYGFSMGGYGSLRYSALFGAKCAISFAPQLSINPDKVGVFDRRYTKYYNKQINCDMEIDRHHLAPDSYLFFDPFEREDYRHALEIASLGTSVRLIKVPSCGHDCIRPFASRRFAVPLIEACRKGNSSALISLVREARKSYDQRIYYFLKAVSKIKPSLAVQLLPDIIDQTPIQHRYKLWGDAAIAFMNKKEFDQAIGAVDNAIASKPNNEKLLQLRSRIILMSKTVVDIGSREQL